jgi:hypothetical protein
VTIEPIYLLKGERWVGSKQTRCLKLRITVNELWSELETARLALDKRELKRKIL